MTDGGRLRDRRLVAVSNRLPIVLSRGERGEWQLERSSGGLVTALEPLLRDRGGLWIGWPGVDEDDFAGFEGLLERFAIEEGYGIVPLALTEQDRNDFYLGFSNSVIWPLFHDLQERCDFDPRYWDAYRRVNRKFARVVAANAREGDLLWVQDYQLMAVAEELRYLGLNERVGFFLHVPFSDPDIFWRLPWRSELLRSLLQFDLIGFQSAQDRDNFAECIIRMDMGAQVEARFDRIILPNGRRVDTGVFPVSIDFDEFAQGVDQHSVGARVEEIRQASGDAQIILGVDRLDYSKGLAQKLLGFRMALERNPELLGRVTLIQLVVPSREDITEYNEMKEEVERLVGSIHGEFATHDWSPIRYIYGSWDRDELLAHYRTARVALVTPLKDGMNLVAKEYAVAGPDDGVLILSEFAGAAAQMSEDALLVNPFDVEGVAETIRRAANMESSERSRRMHALRDGVRREDIHWWLASYLRSFEHSLEATQPRTAGSPPSSAARYERRRRERRRYWYSAEA